MLGGVLQPLDHLPLDGGADGRVGRVPQVLGGAFQSVLIRFGKCLDLYQLHLPLYYVKPRFYASAKPLIKLCYKTSN